MPFQALNIRVPPVLAAYTGSSCDTNLVLGCLRWSGGIRPIPKKQDESALNKYPKSYTLPDHTIWTSLQCATFQSEVRVIRDPGE
jgi:hypothetical protein